MTYFTQLLLLKIDVDKKKIWFLTKQPKDYLKKKLTIKNDFRADN